MSAPVPPNQLANVDQITFANMERHDGFRRVCPDWRTEYITSTDHDWLTNDIHPAFAEDRFFAKDNFNHHETLLARRFASRVLEAKCAIPFWWALLFGEAFLVGPNGGRVKSDTRNDLEARAAELPAFTWEEALRGGREEILKAFRKVREARLPSALLRLVDPPLWHRHTSNLSFPPESPTEITPEQIIATKAALRDLARVITYKLSNTKGIECLTVWHSKIADTQFRGSPSVITINSRELSAHSIAMQGDRVIQAYASFALGFVLVKQLAHAAIGASRLGHECNWGNQYKFGAEDKVGAEIRMLESCTFGGEFRKEQEVNSVCHYTINGHEGIAGLWIAYSDYADSDMFAMFGDVASDPSEAAEQEEGPFYHREWQVPLSWFLKVLTDDFWDVDVHERGQPAMVPPREVGYVMSRCNDRKHGPYHSDEIRRGIVPRGWSMLPRSYVFTTNELHNDALGAILFGNAGEGRMARGISEERQRREVETTPPTDLTDHTSVSSSSTEDDDDDDSMEDA